MAEELIEYGPKDDDLVSAISADVVAVVEQRPVRRKFVDHKPLRPLACDSNEPLPPALVRRSSRAAVSCTELVLSSDDSRRFEAADVAEI